jgi:hypothetical protein
MSSRRSSRKRNLGLLIDLGFWRFISMPVINDRYYMNPQYGAAQEKARADDESNRLKGEPQASWLDRLLSLDEMNNEHGHLTQGGSGFSSKFREPAVNEVGYKQETQKVPEGTKAAKPPSDCATVGNSMYNEASGLRPTSPTGAGSAQDLSSARVGLAGVTKNRDSKGTPVGKGTAPGQLSKAEADGVKTYPPAMRAYEDSQAAAGKVTGDRNGPQSFYLDHGQSKPRWAEGRQPKESFGPFRNAAGGGDVPKGAVTWIRIYD